MTNLRHSSLGLHYYVKNNPRKFEQSIFDIK